MAKKKESATAEARKAKESPKVSHLTWFHEIFEKSHHSSYSYEFFKTCILFLVAVPVFLTGFFYSREEARPGSFIIDVLFFYSAARKRHDGRQVEVAVGEADGVAAVAADGLVGGRQRQRHARLLLRWRLRRRGGRRDAARQLFRWPLLPRPGALQLSQR